MIGANSLTAVASQRLCEDAERRIVSKCRLRQGLLGRSFGRGAWFYLLRDRFYIGQANYKGEIYPGEQLVILHRELFGRVQRTLSEQWRHSTRMSFTHLLTGLIFDDACYHVTPTRA
ncbi:MAG: hypothetical protein J0H71_15155 [Rhizobiales bacterium]|nr:hypothetical protein [Hyphomicrobiales bacterium]